MIYICVPTYNEARTVGVLLWKIRQVMAEFPRDYQVLLADDGSTDATPEVLAPYTRVLPLTIYRHEERHGYAASIEKLLREVVRRSDYPRRDIIVTLQADFTDEPEEIPTLVRRIEGGADVVTGALTLSAAQAPRSVRWTHRLLGYLVRRGRWPEGVTDPLSGFRAYRVITVKKVLDERNGRPLFEGQGWVANVELLRAVAPYARRVDEAPVQVRYDRRFRETRFRPWETVRGILAMLRLAPAGGVAEQSVATGDGDWEEMQTGGAMAEAAERARERGARRRGGRRPRGGARPERSAAEGMEPRGRGGEDRGEGGERVEEEGAGERPVRGGARRPRGPVGEREERQGEGEGEQRGERRRRGGGPRRRPSRVAGEAGTESAGTGVEGSREEAGEVGSGEAGAGEVRRRRRPRRRPSGGAGRSEGGAADSGTEAGGESVGTGPTSSSNEAGAEGGVRRGSGGGRRGRRRGGRRTGAGSQGTPGEESSSNSAADA